MTRSAKTPPPAAGQHHARAPLHPAVVHLPIALLPLSVLLDLASRVWANPDFRLVEGGFVVLLAGILSAAIAAILGTVDYTAIRDDHPAKKTATVHMVLNLIAVGLFAVSLGLRISSLNLPQTGWAPIAVSLVALGVLGYSGYLGGKLVYEDGIGVGRGPRDTPLPARTLEFLAPNAGTPVEVGESPLLDEGGSARVAIGETVVTIARSEGRLCAFQEFCTHRYGPLSEGKIEHGEVVCPWHGSRFSTATGKVTRGPAKVDLRTFPVGEHAGKVWLHDADHAREAGDDTRRAA